MYIVKINHGVTPELFLASDVEVEKNKKFKSNLKITRIDGMIIRVPRDPKVVSIIKK